MAKQIITLVTDDIDGGEAAETVSFGLDGVAYTIDLSEKNAAKLREILGKFIANGQRSRGVPPARVAALVNRKAENQKVRAWANENGWPLAERGRIPVNVQEAYDAARH